MLRPRACRWFELITSRDQFAPVLESLAETGVIELQTHERRAPPLVADAAVERALERFHELARTCGGHWPAALAGSARRVTDPAATLAASLASIEDWRIAAEPVIAEIERSDSQLATLADLHRLLAADPALLPHPSLLAGAGRFLVQVRVYAVGTPVATSELPAEVLQVSVAAGGADVDRHFAIVAGRREAIARVDDLYAARKGRRIDWPPDLQGDVSEAARQVVGQQATLAERRERLQARLQALAQQHDLAGAIADAGLVEWLIRNGSELSASERLVWITGWTTAESAAALSAPLHDRGLRCVVQLPDPPPGTEPPSLLANPLWVRAFEAFPRMVGQPGRDEADPSPLVALIAPLLFGFMFGDVGQGAVLCAAGWLLRKRVPALVLLIPGGAMAMVFGALFGTVFAREDVIPALWLHPLDAPVEVLGAAIGLGAAILFGGLALNALQSHWRGAGREWWSRDAGLVLAYASLLAAVFRRDAWWFALAGALWFVGGAAWSSTGARAATLGRGLAQFVEHAMQLAINTVSFARVGAFALAHAGLSVAVTGVAEASGTAGYWIVLVLGNLLIIVLEGLIVGIQTTRLLLFEFFVRFLQGTGRAFRPLPPPLANAHPGPGSPT